MNAGDTIKLLASITDEGVFERLAAAVLREANPLYASIVHPGVNAAGKTVKSPLDGICFAPGSDPPRIIAFHHTTTARSNLEKKWLYDPSIVKRRKRTVGSTPAGDLLKTAEILADERKRTPDLEATLVLTTNEEPDEVLVRDVHAKGRAYNVEIDLWPRSRLAHFLDHHPPGQWLRREYLGIEQELLSPELLHDLSKKSLDANRPHDDARAWVPRALDTTLANSNRRDVTFLASGSGQGKSVACYRHLATHVKAGGFGLIIPSDIVASAVTLDQAVAITLHNLQFVDRSLSRIAGETKDHPAADYRDALRALAEQMLSQRQIQLGWREVRTWARLHGEPLALLSRLAHQGELIRFTGLSHDQQLSFRHDRVRDWLLADAVIELEGSGLFPDDVMAEPYFAEVIGAALIRLQCKSDFLRRVIEANPLALFHALRLCGQSTKPSHETICEAINQWLDNPVAHSRSNLHLRSEALAMLAETDSHRVLHLVGRFHDRTEHADLARLRNGDLLGGIRLCSSVEPGVIAPWRDAHIDHAKHRFGGNLITALDGFLRRQDLDAPARIGALRLAGHLRDPNLACAVEACWSADNARGGHLADYLWAASQCCGDDPERSLGPVCDAWAGLPSESGSNGLQGLQLSRESLAADQLRWAFGRWPPFAALDYFIQRGQQEDLKWPITYMLHSVDNQKALSFIVRELATIRARIEGARSISPFMHAATDHWRRAQEDGRPMAKASREFLLEIWRNEVNGKHLRAAAFSLWAATQGDSDLDVLRAVPSPGELDNSVLAERLIRGDRSAVSAMIHAISVKGEGSWWHYGRYVWSSALTDALDNDLTKRGDQAKHTWNETFKHDGITSELIIRLPIVDAERLLVKHWEHLRFQSDFVQAALYHSTPRLLSAVETTISECPEPNELLKHLSSRLGIRISGHPGLTRESQVVALTPYLEYLSSSDIVALWDLCNERGWLSTRRNFLDGQLKPPFLREMWSRDSAMLALDRMVANQHPHWVTFWVDDSLKKGALWPDIVATMIEWFNEHRSIQAMRLVTLNIGHRGTREDLASMRALERTQVNGSEQIIADTNFAVRRRTLH